MQERDRTCCWVPGLVWGVGRPVSRELKVAGG